MASNLIWWVGNSLLVVVSIRAVRVGLLRRYPLFYTYIGCVLVKQIIDLFSYHFVPRLYESLFWPTELWTIVASYGVIIEIFRESLRHNPGVARKSQKLLLSLFALTVTYAALDIFHGRSVRLSHTIFELGRDLRYIEGVLLLVVLWLLVRYRISLGRNLLGLIGGYSFWVGLNVVGMWFLTDNEFSALLRRLLPITYVATLTIWCLALWSCQPEPLKPLENAIERDYDLLASKTRAALNRTSDRFAKAMKP
jgi:hypothetical protein